MGSQDDFAMIIVAAIQAATRIAIEWIRRPKPDTSKR